MNCLIIVGPSSTRRRESEVEIRIRTYSDSITSVDRGAGRIEDYSQKFLLWLSTGLKWLCRPCWSPNNYENFFP